MSEARFSTGDPIIPVPGGRSIAVPVTVHTQGGGLHRVCYQLMVGDAAKCAEILPIVIFAGPLTQFGVWSRSRSFNTRSSSPSGTVGRELRVKNRPIITATTSRAFVEPCVSLKCYQ